MNRAALQKIREELDGFREPMQAQLKITYGEMIEILDALLDSDSYYEITAVPFTPDDIEKFVQTQHPPKPIVTTSVPLTTDFPDVVRPQP